MIDTNLLQHLKKISEEEKLLLSGEKNVQKSLYTNDPEFVVDSRKMLTSISAPIPVSYTSLPTNIIILK